MSEFNFDDVEPLPLTPPGVTISVILYSEEYSKSLGLLRALQDKLEYSDRAIYLTEQVIELNAAHYTVWKYRYDNIINLGKDLDKELDWCEEIAVDNIKNYQIWHYRQLLLTKQFELTGVKNAKREFPLIEVMLDDDSKNYHVWSYRKWVVKWSTYWDEEIEFVDRFISNDVYNNSAWSHRYFTFFSNDNNVLKDETEFLNENQYVIEKIKLAPQNVSPWNYLVGIYEGLNKDLLPLKDLALSYANVIENSNELQSIPALELLIKVHKLENQNQLALKGYDLLIEKYDPIRSNYWNYQKNLITNQ